MMDITPKQARALLGAINLAETLRIEFPERWETYGVKYDLNSLAAVAAALADYVEGDADDHLCIHCTLVTYRRTSGLCDPCNSYLSKYGYLPGPASIAKRQRRYRGENTNQKVQEILVDPFILDEVSSLCNSWEGLVGGKKIPA